MKRIVSAILIALAPVSVSADIDILGIELGSSRDEFQKTLIAEQAVFLNVFEDIVVARKTINVKDGVEASRYSFPSYRDVPPVTEIIGKFCDGKLYDVSMTSNFQRNFVDLMLYRKAVYNNLIASNAALSEITPHLAEDNINVFETFTIDHNALAGKQRGEELLKFGIIFPSPNQPVSGLSLYVNKNNRWYCPD